MKFYQHKEKPEVICDSFDNKFVRFGRWVWSGDTCSEVYKHKEITPEFHTVFNEVSQKQFNDIWGDKLQKA